MVGKWPLPIIGISAVFMAANLILQSYGYLAEGVGCGMMAVMMMGVAYMIRYEVVPTNIGGDQ